MFCREIKNIKSVNIRQNMLLRTLPCKLRIHYDDLVLEDFSADKLCRFHPEKDPNLARSRHLECMH